MVKALSFLEKNKFSGSRKEEDSLALLKLRPLSFSNRGQYKIQQMAFMILAVFFFFILVGLFFLGWQFRNIGSDYEQLQREQAISSLKVIADMPEFNCDSRTSLCLDEDKLMVFSGNDLGREYSDFWPVASIKVYKVYPKFNETIPCPNAGCNYYEVFDSGQINVEEYPSYVSICRKMKVDGYVYDRCEIGKMLVGIKKNE